MSYEVVLRRDKFVGTSVTLASAQENRSFAKASAIIGSFYFFTFTFKFLSKLS